MLLDRKNGFATMVNYLISDTQNDFQHGQENIKGVKCILKSRTLF